MSKQEICVIHERILKVIRDADVPLESYQRDLVNLTNLALRAAELETANAMLQSTARL